MLDTVQETIHQYDMLRAGDRVLCAVSGGADSVALLRALLALSGALGVTVCACHVNHMLRGEEADRDECFVRELCGSLSVPLTVAQRDVAAFAATHGLGTEEAAREVRYAALREAAASFQANKTALAHTLDDNLETMLFHLARGTGPLGLGGIPPVRGELIRPLIGMTRAQVESFLLACEQPFMHDSTNDSTDYTRNRIRREVIPVLRQINPRCAEAAGRSARLLRKDEQYLAAQAETLRRTMCRKSAQGVHIGCRALRDAPDVLRGRILRATLREAGLPMVDCTSLIIRELTALALAQRVDGQRSLPGGMVAVRQYDDLFLGALPERAAPAEIPLKPGCREELWQKGTTLTVCAQKNAQDFNKTFNTFAADCGKINLGTLCVRTRRQGDTLRLTARGGHRTLKRLMIDKRIPRYERDGIAVIADDQGVIAVQGLGLNLDRQPDTGPILIFTFEGIKEHEE